MVSQEKCMIETLHAGTLRGLLSHLGINDFLAKAGCRGRFGAAVDAVDVFAFVLDEIVLQCFR